MRLETFILIASFSQACMFGSELLEYWGSGDLKVHRGEYGFADFSVIPEHLKTVLIHGALMFLWLGAVVYQMKSRGKGLHKVVGYLSMASMLYGMISIIPVASRVPAAHAVLYLSAIDFITVLTAVAILISGVLGMYLIYIKKVGAHRTMMLSCILFSGAPGTFRIIFKVGMWLLPLVGIQVLGYQLYWNEMSLLIDVIVHLWWVLYLIGWKEFFAVCRMNMLLGAFLQSLVVGLTGLFVFMLADVIVMWQNDVPFPGIVRSTSGLWQGYMI